MQLSFGDWICAFSEISWFFGIFLSNSLAFSLWLVIYAGILLPAQRQPCPQLNRTGLSAINSTFSLVFQSGQTDDWCFHFRKENISKLDSIAVPKEIWLWDELACLVKAWFKSLSVLWIEKIRLILLNREDQRKVSWKEDGKLLNAQHLWENC